MHRSPKRTVRLPAFLTPPSSWIDAGKITPRLGSDMLVQEYHRVHVKNSTEKNNLKPILKRLDLESNGDIRVIACETEQKPDAHRAPSCLFPPVRFLLRGRRQNEEEQENSAFPLVSVDRKDSSKPNARSAKSWRRAPSYSDDEFEMALTMKLLQVGSTGDTTRLARVKVPCNED
ncbi:hypothetical protein C8J57DRAFT_1228551 [Mycena rebaudengoi]|nr:hypothetical protein C8J57DRAFT_1228551 [Mycena rebaudengoi]